MGKILRRRAAALRAVEFCETCAQVCTAECRSQVRVDQARTWAAAQLYPFAR
jgi:hypothetical protein